MSNGTGQHCANASYEGKNKRSSAGKVQTKLPCSLRKESLANHQADLSTKTPPLMPTLYSVPWDQVSDTLHISTSISGLTKCDKIGSAGVYAVYPEHQSKAKNTYTVGSALIIQLRFRL